MTHDKAKVENAVQVVQRWILAALRKRKFFSLEEANQAIAELLVKLNDKPFRKREGTRRSWFEAADKPALAPLPVERYQTGEWRKLKVELDYHVPVEGHFYSVPYRLVGHQVVIRITTAFIEIFEHSVRVASHVRSLVPDQATTLAEHRPKAHQQYLEWTPSRLLGWGETNGPNTAQLFAKILVRRENSGCSEQPISLGRDPASARQSSGRPALFLMDVFLPSRSGLLDRHSMMDNAMYCTDAP